MNGRSNGRARVGLVGCGVIAKAYAEGAQAFDSFSVDACADSDAERAQSLGAAHGLEVMSVEGLIASPEIDVVLNLTPPDAHAAVVGGALDAGKHVYTEKPLTTSVSDARELLASATRLGLRIGCAPDTFLGSAYEAARELIARGDIGVPLGATAAMLVGGADTWHPNADFFFRAGGGPMLDLGPYYLTAIASLLGPFAVGDRVSRRLRRPSARSRSGRARASASPSTCRRTSRRRSGSRRAPSRRSPSASSRAASTTAA